MFLQEVKMMLHTTILNGNFQLLSVLQNGIKV